MYTTQAKIENFFGVTLTAAQIASLTDVLAGVKLFIDNYVGGTFESSWATKYYDGVCGPEIDIDSYVTAGMSVEILNDNGTTQRTLTKGQANDYIPRPQNTTVKNAILLTRNGRAYRFPHRYSSLKVIANFGFSAAVPADISIVATRLAYEFLRNDTPEGMIKTSESLGDYSVDYEFMENAAKTLGIYDILDTYRTVDI